MPASSQVGAMRAALKALLVTRQAAGLSGVEVNSFEPGEDDKKLTHIWFENVTVDREHETKVTTDDALEFQVVVYVQKAGDGDTVAAAVEDRALELFAEVEDTVTDDRTLTSSVDYAEVTRYEITNLGGAGNRICAITMVISARSELTAA